MVNRLRAGSQGRSGQSAGQDTLDLLRVSATVGNEVVNVKHAELVFLGPFAVCVASRLGSKFCSGLVSCRLSVAQGTRVPVVGGVSATSWGKHWLISVESEWAWSN